MRPAIKLALTAALFGALCLAKGTYASPGAYQIDAAHTGSIDFKGGFAPPLERRWVRQMHGWVSYPLVANGLVFVTVGDKSGNNGRLVALNANTGKTVWERQIVSAYNAPSAAYDDGKIFVSTPLGPLQAYSADSNGALLWSYPLNDGGLSPPVASHGQVFTTSSQLYAIDEATGLVNWSEPLGDLSVTVGVGRLYIDQMCGSYAKLSEADGHIIWLDQGCANGADWAAYFRGKVYALDPENGNHVLDARNGAVLGSFGADLLPAFYEDSGGRQFSYALFNQQIYAVDLATGNVVWNFAGDGQLDTAPIVINGNVVAGSFPGELYVLDGHTGELLWSTNVGTYFYNEYGPVSGFGAGDGALVVPARYQLSLYAPQKN